MVVWCRMFDTEACRHRASECCWTASSTIQWPARVHRVRHGAPGSPPRRPANPAVPFNALFGHLQLLPGVGRPACGRVSRQGTVPVAANPSATAVSVRDGRLYDGGPNDDDFDSS